jgi:hypothetical protein
MRAGDVSRRRFLQHGGMLALATALAELPALLDARGLLETAAAQSPDLTHDTLSGLVAFALPGDDAYSVAQGESFAGPGGVAAGAPGAMIRNLDQYIPVFTGPGETAIPASAGVAAGLNDYALTVNPAAAAGAFPSPFARLTFAEKVEALRRFESEPAAANTELRFVGAILPGFAAYLAMSEAPYWDRSSRTMTAKPLAWEITQYRGPTDITDELIGYWKGHRKAIPSRRSRRRRRR